MKIYRKILFLLLFGLIFLRFSISFLIITSFPKLEASFNLNNLQLGIIISIYFAMSAIFNFVWVYTFGKYSKYKVFLISSFFWIFGCLLFGFSQNYLLLIVSAGIIGIGIESSTIMIFLLLFEMNPQEEQAKIFSSLIIVQGAGSLFGVLITAYFEDILCLSWNFVFLFIGILSLIWILIVSIFLLRVEGINTILKPHLDNIRYDLNFKEIVETLKKKTNLNMIILFSYSVPIVFFFNLWIQLYFQEYHGLTQMEAAISYIFLSGGEFLGTIFGGIIYDKVHSEKNYKKRYLPILGIAISIPLFLIGFYLFWDKNSGTSDNNLLYLSLDLFLYAFNNYFVFICYIMLFFGFFSLALIYPFFLIVINDCNRQKEKGIMIGLKNFIEILGQAISPIIGGIIADSFSVLGVFLFIPFFLFFPLIHLILIRNLIERDFLLINEKPLTQN